MFEELHPRVAKLARERFSKATPIQEKAFAPILSRRHTLLIAPTGIGKTEAALLPVLSMMLSGSGKGITTLYITPLKALNRDMLSRISWWTERLGISVGVRHGDTTQYQRSKQAKSPPQLLITTPETLQSILPAKRMGQHLSSVRHVIVDEIHELVESKRGAQLAVALERLVERAGEFQRIGISATVGSPELTAAFLCGRREVDISYTSPERGLSLSVELPKPTAEDTRLSRVLKMRPSTVARLRRLHSLVQSHTTVLAFVNTRAMAELLTSRYAAWDTSHSVRVHHSSLSKDVRLVAEKGLKQGKVRGIIATSSLELGIDIGSIDIVVQYQSPRQATRLVQRVGRSGHSASKSPKGIIISSDAEDALEAAAVCENSADHKLEEPRPHMLALDVLAHQLIGISMDMGAVSIEKAYSIVRRAFPFAELDRGSLLSVLHQLAGERYAHLSGNSYRKAGGAFRYYFSNVSMIPDEEKMFVKDVTTNSNVGALDESFVAESLKPGATFITKGAPWAVLDIHGRDVLVEPATDYTAAIPDWEGQELPVPFSVAQAVGKARRTGVLPPFLSPAARAAVKASIARQKRQGFLPSDRTVAIEAHDDFVVVHTHFGTLANEAIGKALSSLLTSSIGSSVRTRIDAYRIILEYPARSSPQLVRRLLMGLSPSSIRGILEATVSRSSLFRWKFVQVAKRFGLFEKGASYQRVSLRSIINAVGGSPIYAEALRDLFTEQFGIATAKKCLSDIQSKKIRLIEVSLPKPSEFASFSRKASGLFLPERAESEILDMVKARVLGCTVGFECMSCHNRFYGKLQDMPGEIRCPKCGGAMVTLLKAKDKQRVASLINAYGKRAAIALQARGVGPETAARLLKRLRRTDDEFFRDLLEAEKTFARTKHYWR